MCSNASVVAVAALASAEQQHGYESDPTSHRMHHHRTGEVVKLRTERAVQPVLHAEATVPGDAFEKRIQESHQQKSSGELRIEACALCDPAGHDGRNRSRKGEQEEKAGELVAALLRQ